MKKSLLIGLTGVALIATTIYAQTAAGSTVIARMKSAVANFTLTNDLNPGQTGLQSAPLSGKKTGDILTAGEWNRVLELVSAGGTGGSGAGWVDVPLTDTSNFDDSCMYRYISPNLMPAGYAGTNYWSYPQSISATHIVNNTDSGAFGHIYAATKNTYRVNGGAADTITKMQKLCGGGGAGSGGSSNITWANFDGSGGVAMKGSNGITSIVRESAGNYRVTFSTPRPNMDYGVICTSGPSPSYLCFPHEKSTTSFLIKTSNPSNNVDAPFVSLIVTPFDIGVSSTGWENVPLTDTADFNVECDYRLKYTANFNGSSAPYVSADDWVYHPSRVGKKIIWWYGPTVLSHTKNVLYWSNDQNGDLLNATATWGYKLTTLQKRCN